jgi:hypothetical protein
MLNISHKQTTAYHPESNDAVERLSRRLKDALHAGAAVATWSEELSFVLLGLRAQLRKDTGLSLAEAVFGAQIVLPNEFLENDELSVDTIVMFLLLLCLGTILAPTCPASWQPSCSLPPSSGSVRAAWFHPFSRSTMAPTRFCAAAPAPSPSESGLGTRWSLSAALRPAWQGMPRLAARVTPADCRLSSPGTPAATKRVSFSDPLVSSPSSSSSAPPRDSPETVFLPGKEVFAHPGPAAPSQPPQTGTRPVNGHRPRG